MTTPIVETIANLEENHSEVAIAWREHQAFKECVEFDGDTCDACDEFDRELSKAQQAVYSAKRALRAITVYNRTYARAASVMAVRRPDTDMGDNLVRAHAYAAAHTKEVLRGGRTCPNCAGSGAFWLKTAGTNADGSQRLNRAVCFGCQGQGRQTDADRIRNRVYWDKYARVSL